MDKVEIKSHIQNRLLIKIKKLKNKVNGMQTQPHYIKGHTYEQRMLMMMKTLSRTCYVRNKGYK